MIRAVDLFAGAGGWDIGAQRLGIMPDGIEIMAEAQATRAGNGLKTIMSDVRDFRPERGTYDLVIGSPPCQPFSMSGGGAGRRALDAVVAVVHSYLTPWPVSFARAAELTGDERTALVVEPLRVILAVRPTFVALEQVAPVLPVWRAYAHVLQRFGYSVAVGIVNAEQHGVPQTRKRAILVARRDGGVAALPAPTHSAFHVREPRRLDTGVLPWVSMAQALGWPGAGVAGLPRRADDGEVVELDGEHYRARDLRGSKMANAARRPAHQPAPTINFGHDRNSKAWMQGDVVKRPIALAEAAALQSFPADFTFAGAMTKQFLQVGNAVPPLMAQAILTALTGNPPATEQLSLFGAAA